MVRTDLAKPIYCVARVLGNLGTCFSLKGNCLRCWRVPVWAASVLSESGAGVELGLICRQKRPPPLT